MAAVAHLPLPYDTLALVLAQRDDFSAVTLSATKTVQAVESDLFRKYQHDIE